MSGKDTTPAEATAAAGAVYQDAEKIFGGCGCGSPFAHRTADGNIVISFPDEPLRGKLVVTPLELKALRGMITLAERQEKL